MVERRPLVTIAGQVQELPSGDSLPGGGGGSGATGGTATLNFGAQPGTGMASVAVTGQALIGAGARVRVWFQGAASADHNAYVHARIFPSRIGLAAEDITAGVGFTITAETEMRLAGDVICYWEWSN